MRYELFSPKTSGVVVQFCPLNTTSRASGIPQKVGQAPSGDCETALLTHQAKLPGGNSLEVKRRVELKPAPQWIDGALVIVREFHRSELLCWSTIPILSGVMLNVKWQRHACCGLPR